MKGERQTLVKKEQKATSGTQKASESSGAIGRAARAAQRLAVKGNGEPAEHQWNGQVHADKRGKRGRGESENYYVREASSSRKNHKAQRSTREEAVPSHNGEEEEMNNDEGEGDSEESDDIQEIVAPFQEIVAPFRGPARGEDDFCPGNILSIYVENFMTYNRISLQPSPRLNLIIGPNGTGKSSLVCAIGIGLGGEPRMLGRATEIGQFVQRGHESGLVRIELRGEEAGHVYTVERQIDDKNHSEWSLNGARATKKDVKELMQRLNIQVDNLTQFLPQDRVCEFAGLSKERLLEETMKAVGDPELSKQHAFLIQARDEIKALENNTRVAKETLDRLKEANEEIQGDVERLRKREELLEEAKMMKKKEPWIEASRLEAYCAELQEGVDGLNREIDELLPQKVSAEQAFRRVRDTREAKSKDLSEFRERIKVQQRVRREAQEREARVKGEIGDAESKIRQLQAQARTMESNKHKYRSEVEHLERELSEMPPLVHPKDQLAPISQRLEVAGQAMAGKEQDLQSLERSYNHIQVEADRTAQRLRQARDTRYRRIRLCQDPRLEEACNWLENHRSQCRGVVYGPLITEVNVEDRAHAAALEQHVPFYVWKAFVTTNEQDRDYLVQNMKQFKVTVINESGNEEHFRTSEGLRVTDDMRRLGVTHRMDELFSAAPVVRYTLIKQGALDRAFIASARVDSNPDLVDRIHALGICDLSTPSANYSWRGSRYHSSMSTSIVDIRGPRVLGHDGGLKEEEALESELQGKQQHLQQMQAQLSELKAEIAMIDNELAQVHRERDAITRAYHKEKKRRGDMQERLDRRRQNLLELEGHSGGQLQQQEEKCKAQISNLLVRRFEALHAGHVALYNECQLTMKQVQAVLALEELGQLSRDRERVYREMEKRLIELQRELDAACRYVEDNRRKAREQREKARAEADYEGDPELKELFDSLPDNVDELREVVKEKEEAANRIAFGNPNALDEFQRRQNDIHRRQAALQEDTQKLNHCNQRLETEKNKWLPRLRGLVSRISETFSANFREMAVAGEVVLDEHGDEFKNYGIRVRVQFRDTAPMQDLSSHHQSGGERSVSTILYLVALQELSYCPFRVVDEINQGMDAQNERKMFQQLVRATCRENTPQCFLITPKLLPNLEYGDRCTIHTVMNGPYISDFANISGFKDGAPLAKALLNLCNLAGA